MVDVEVVEAVGVRSLSRKHTHGMDGMDGMDADSSRRPLPFARLFSLFGHRAALLLMVAPCVSFLIAAVQTIAWSAGTIRARDLILWNEEHANRATAEQMALLEVPAKFVGNLVFMLLAWQLHVVNRPGGPYQVLSQQRLPKPLHRWVRNLILLVVVVFVLYLATLAVLAFRRSRTGVVIADDGVTWPDTLRTISAILGIGNFPLPLINSCQTFVSIAAVVSELKDIAALIESCEESSWGTVVIPAAKRAVRVSQPAFAYWGMTVAASVVYLSYMFLLFLLRFTVDPSGTYAATAGIIFVIVVIFLAVGLQIDSACKTVEKALSRRALDKLETSPAAAEPAIALREVLSKGESWGFKLMGVCLTKVLLVKVVSGALTLLTVLTKFVDEGELESASGPVC